MAEADKTRLATLAQKILDVRADFPESCLADLYDRLTMPPSLRKAHTALDVVVEKLYRPKPFADERKRAEHLLALYEALSAPLLVASQQKPKRSQK